MACGARSGAVPLTGIVDCPSSTCPMRVASPMTVGPDRRAASRYGLTLLFNGEIYNFRLLREELKRDGHRLRSATDSEVLLHLYEADGLAMLPPGRIFSFAIHDKRPGGRPDGVDKGPGSSPVTTCVKPLSKVALRRSMPNVTANWKRPASTADRPVRRRPPEP